MPKITRLIAREIFDSRGVPTIQAELSLEENITVTSCVPSGASVGKYEAVELRDGGKRLFGKGVTKAIDNIERVIAPQLIGKELSAVDLDQLLIALDGTSNKKKLGANATLAVSQALYRAQAIIEGVELYELLAWVNGQDQVAMPIPMFNVINGGAHADNGLKIQEFMVAPLGAASYKEACEAGMTFSHQLKQVLKDRGKMVAVGDEGGYACAFDDDIQALDCIMDTMVKLGKNGSQVFGIALDVAASQFYKKDKKKYEWYGGEMITAGDLISLYAELAKNYPIYSIEDGLDEDDWSGWQKLTEVCAVPEGEPAMRTISPETHGTPCQIVGDDLFCTNVKRIAKGLELGAANAVIIKPNQIGTITEAMQAIQFCQQHGLNTIISHRSGETCDTFIADLAVGTSAGQIKAGGCSRGERVSKYNRLLTIEDHLMRSLMDKRART